jgi:hypothetical protein
VFKTSAGSGSGMGFAAPARSTPAVAPRRVALPA